MQFTTSEGTIIRENWILNVFDIIIGKLEQHGETDILFWEREFLEWFLNRKIEYQVNGYGNESCYIYLNKHITQDELEQLKQLIDYLEF